MLFDFHNPKYASNHPYNLHQNFSLASFYLPNPPFIVHKSHSYNSS